MKERYQGLFDDVFVSARFAQLLQEPTLDSILKLFFKIYLITSPKSS